MLNVQMTSLEAAAVMSLLLDTAKECECYGNETMHDTYMCIAQRIGQTIASTRAELTEADLV